MSVAAAAFAHLSGRRPVTTTKEHLRERRPTVRSGGRVRAPVVESHDRQKATGGGHASLYPTRCCGLCGTEAASPTQVVAALSGGSLGVDLCRLRVRRPGHLLLRG